MYDRAPRKLASPIGSTPGHVGPGTYGSHEVTAVKQLSDSYAPFNSLTSRETNLIPDSIASVPGPGQYNPKVPQEFVKGASSLTNKSQRFKSTQSDVPGPGSYSIRSTWTKPDWPRTVPCSAPPVTGNPSTLQQRDSADQTKFKCLPAAPSIPCPGQAFGYEENEDGLLHRQAPPHRDSSLGPAFYNPPANESSTTKRYKGIHWGRMRSTRSNNHLNDGPGPGEYEIKSALDRRVTSTQSEVLLNPRNVEQTKVNEAKQGNPGPGAYMIKREFEKLDKTPVNKQVERLMMEHPPFLSQSKRFHSAKAEYPPPGAYNDPREALEALKKPASLKQSPFGQTSLRFQRDRRALDVPAPNMYSSMRGMAAESMYKAYISSTQRGAFGSSTQRLNPMSDHNSTTLPGPGTYQVNDSSKKESSLTYSRGVIRASANFVSQSERIGKADKSEVPPPTAYNVDKSFQFTHYKKEPGPPRNEAARRRHESFMSSAARFAPPRDVISSAADPRNPGPGAYNPTISSEKGNMITVRDAREKPLKKDVPGPGYYDFSPLIMDTVLRGTFNVTLCNLPSAASRSVMDKKFYHEEPEFLPAAVPSIAV